MGPVVKHGGRVHGLILASREATRAAALKVQTALKGDGMAWDHFSSQEAVAIAANAKTPQAASDRIAQIARERWRRNGPMQDDITAVVVGLN